jgi:hypothetical protein
MMDSDSFGRVAAKVPPRLYSSRQVGTAAFLAGPIAGGWLLALNLHRTGDRKSSRITIASTIIGTLGLALFVMILPTDFPNIGVPVVIGGVFALAYRFSFESEYKKHVQAGAVKASNWAVLGSSLVGLLCVLALFLVVALIVPITAMNHAKFADNTIYFEGRATRADAQELGEFLTEQGMFFEGSLWDVTLVFPGTRFEEVRIQVPMEQPNPEVRRAIVGLIGAAEQGIYSGRRVFFEVQNALGITIERISSD